MSGVVQTTRSIDVDSLNEDQFEIVVRLLNQIIDATESYLALHVDTGDTSQFCFLGDSVQRLKDARHWIAQGYSPDPAKRPSAADLEQRMYREAEEVFKHFEMSA